MQLVAAAADPRRPGRLGLPVLDRGKHYFTDKPPLTTLAQLAQARETAAVRGEKYAVYYSERLHVECAVYAGVLVQAAPSAA